MSGALSPKQTPFSEARDLKKSGIMSFPKQNLRNERLSDIDFQSIVSVSFFPCFVG